MKKLLALSFLSFGILVTTSSSLAQLPTAQQLYENGQFNEAIAVLEGAITKWRSEAAIADYQAQGNISEQVLALRNLALVHQQLGEWEQAQQALDTAFNLIPNLGDSQAQNQLWAQTLEVQGQLQLTLGEPEAALDTWKQTAATYQQNGDITGFTKSQIYQAQALQALGLYAQATKTLTKIQSQLEAEPDSLLKVKALQSVGDVLRRVGNYEASQSALAQSLTIAEKLAPQQVVADIFLSLGNIARLQGEADTALKLYQRAINISALPDTKVQAQLNQLSVLVKEEEWGRAEAFVPQIERSLEQLSPSRLAVDARINLARNLIKIEGSRPNKKKITNYLAQAVKMARELGDKRSESEALGNLGKLYEQHQRWEEAQQLTERALLLAQGIKASELAYQWQWQLGRILAEEGKPKDAITAYTQSVKTLQSLRGDLVAISSDVQFSFRESVEPVYRELASLLLQPGANQQELAQARKIIESLQLAELDNFFRDACLDTQPVQIDELDTNAAILYTIILRDRLEVIAALPNQPLRHYSTNLPQAEIENALVRATNLISNNPNRRIPMDLLTQLYNWLIRPIEADLAANELDTLVFVPDGALRNLPPSILHDGEQYLVEKYRVAIAPSLQLVDPRPFNRTNRQLLLAGLSEARQGFSELPGVETELASIEAQFPSSTLLNESFTKGNFNQLVNVSPYQVIHLATHGSFSSKAEETFILAWDDRINIEELNRLIRSDQQQLRPIELLVLSACETATGDKQAALGLAGMAVRAGARSTLASLWAVSDETTSLLMTHFYQELAEGEVSKAEALRRAQVEVLQEQEFSHPYYWSAFILVGNWL